MSPGQPITIELGNPPRRFAIRWTKRAEARNSTLARPQSFGALNRPGRRLGAMCTLLWAALVDRDHEFAEPEDLAEYLQTAEQQVAAIKALRAIVDEAFPEKKSAVSDDSSANGPSPSSKPESAPPGSTGGT